MFSNQSNDSVDVEFVLSLKEMGVDFMLKAAKTRVELFDKIIDQGWSKEIRGHWQENSFFLDLQQNIKDKDRAVHVMNSMLKNATVEEVNDALLGRVHSEEAPMRSWLRAMDSSRHDKIDPDWLRNTMACAVSLGMSFDTEFSHKTEHTPSQKNTLLSSFVSDMCCPGKPGKTLSTNGSWSDGFLAPIHLILEFQKIPDKLSIVQPLKYMNEQDCMSIFKIFEEKGDFSATHALQMVGRSKIANEKLAPLQARSAREAVDDVMAQANLKSFSAAP